MRPFFALLLAVAVAGPTPAEAAFSVRDCVAQWTRDVDAAFRLTPEAAQKQCAEIDRRVRALSARMVGAWARPDSSGATETMTLNVDGSAQLRTYRYDLGRVVPRTTTWAIVNPYGTAGSEVLKFGDQSFVSDVKVTSDELTITSQPARDPVIERWSRVR